MDQLYGGSHGDAATEALWAYMPYGPFADEFAMRAWLERCAASEDPLFLTVSSQESGRRIGMVSFLNFVAASRVVELGHIWYGPAVDKAASRCSGLPRISLARAVSLAFLAFSGIRLG